jgi:hypothetical protein
MRSIPSLFEKEKVLLWSAFSLITYVTQKVIRPSPLAPLPKRERETRKKLKTALAPLLPEREKGLGDEGRFSICVR